MQRQPFEHASARGEVARTEASEGSSDGRFNRTVVNRTDAPPSSGETKNGSPTIARIVETHQQSLINEPLKHAGKGTWMHMQDGRQIPS
jgi:hypothetical protein